jgi:hypothetical protein
MDELNFTFEFFLFSILVLVAEFFIILVLLFRRKTHRISILSVSIIFAAIDVLLAAIVPVPQKPSRLGSVR